jgi:hypothetical protein
MKSARTQDGSAESSDKGGSPAVLFHFADSAALADFKKMKSKGVDLNEGT